LGRHTANTLSLARETGFRNILLKYYGAAVKKGVVCQGNLEGKGAMAWPGKEVSINSMNKDLVLWRISKGVEDKTVKKTKGGQL